MGKSVPTPQYYTPDNTAVDEAEEITDDEVEAKDITDNDVKKTSTQSMYFAQQQADATDDEKETKSFYTSGTSKNLGSE